MGNDELKSKVDSFSPEFEYMVEHSFIDVDGHVEHPPVAISAGVFQSGGFTYPTPLVTYGNIMFVQAPPKSKKSFFVSLLASSYLNGKKEFVRHIKGHPDGRKLLHIDTEQGTWHASRAFKRVMDMSEAKKEMYEPYALRGHSHDDIIMFIESYMYRNKDVGVIIVDGVADLVVDENDLKSSKELILFLMRISAQYKCAIITVIHSNYGSEKPMGHLGSFLEKKAETQIQLTVNPSNTDIITAKCKRSRNTPFDDIYFRINRKHYPEVMELDDPFED